MKNFMLFLSVVVIFCSCSKEKTNAISIKPTDPTPKPVYDTFSLRVVVGDWYLDPWAVLDDDSAYYTILPRFSTLPGLAGKADSIKKDNIISVKIKTGGLVFQVGHISNRPFSYNLTNAPIGGPNDKLMIHCEMPDLILI